MKTFGALFIGILNFGVIFLLLTGGIDILDIMLIILNFLSGVANFTIFYKNLKRSKMNRKAELGAGTVIILVLILLYVAAIYDNSKKDIYSSIKEDCLKLNREKFTEHYLCYPIFDLKHVYPQNCSNVDEFSLNAFCTEETQSKLLGESAKQNCTHTVNQTGGYVEVNCVQQGMVILP